MTDIAAPSIGGKERGVVVLSERVSEPCAILIVGDERFHFHRVEKATAVVAPLYRIAQRRKG